MSFRLGIVGAGRAGALHARTAAEVGLEVGGVCDVDLERAEELANQSPDAMATDSLQELLARPDIDAVVVAIPNVFHCRTAIAALRAGKDVLLEKPMAMNARECDRIIEAVRETGRLLQIAFVCRCFPATCAARELIDAGRLGRIYHAKASVYRQRGIPGLGRWFTTKAQSGGGVLMDLGVHLIDLVLYLTGFPRAVRASAACTSTFGSPPEAYRYTEMWAGPPNLGGPFDVEDGVTALVHFDDGMTMELNATWAVDLPEGMLHNGVVLLGKEGGCHFDPWRGTLVLTTEEDGRLVEERRAFPEEDPWEAAWRGEYELFSTILTRRLPPTASAEQGRTVQALIDALYRSAQEGREVVLDSTR